MKKSLCTMLGIILVLMQLIGVFTISVSASDASYRTDGITLLDMGNNMDLIDANTLRASGRYEYNKDIAYTYGSAKTSLKFNTAEKGSVTFKLKALGAETDWSDYAKLGMHFYADSVGTTFRIFANKSEGDTGENFDGANAYYHYTYITEKTGWQYVELPLVKFTATFKGTNTASLEMIQSLSFVSGNWGSEGFTDTNIYFDELYLAGVIEPNVFLDCTADEFQISDFGTRLTADTSVKYKDAPFSMKLDLSIANDNQWMKTATLKAHRKQTTLEGYDYFKIRMYVPEEVLKQKKAITLVINQKLADGTWTDYRPAIALNWSYSETDNGWYTVKIPLKTMTKKSNNLAELTNETNSIWLNVGGYGQTAASEGSALYIDKIWLDKVDGVLLDCEEEGENIFDFTNVDCNYYYGDALGSLKMNVGRNSSGGATDNTLLTSSMLASKGKKIDLAGYDTLNIRAYMPEALFDTTNTAATNGTTTGAGRIRVKISYTIDGKGYWYIPIVNFNSTYTPNAWNTITLNIANLTKKDASAAYPTPDNAFTSISFHAGYYGHDLMLPAGSYMYVDKVWLAKNEETTPDAFTVDSQSYNGRDNSAVFTFSNELGKVEPHMISVVDSENNKLIGWKLLSDRAAKKVTVDLAGVASYGTKYTVKLTDIPDCYGQVVSSEYELTTAERVFESDDIVKQITDTTFRAIADVYNTLEEPKKVSIILAVYNEDGSLASVRPGTVTLNEGERKTISLSRTRDGKTTKAFVWEASGSIRPLKDAAFGN